MKFFYIDESGTGGEPYAVMVGIIVDSQRMHVSKRNWFDLLEGLSKTIERDVSEIHTRDFYPGNSPWRNLDGNTRAGIITLIFKWLADRKHKIVYSAVDKEKFHCDFEDETCSGEVGSLWRFLALHVCLSIQKHFQKLKKTKGNTILIFDNEEREAPHFTEIINNPPDWTDSYYSRSKNQYKLDQIIDVPYFADSKHAGLIQVADFVSFFLRRFIEIKEGAVPEKYNDEKNLVNGWITMAMKQAIPKASIYPSRNRCECSDLFYRYAPACIL